MAEYARPNFFVNTPDILSAYLQVGGQPAFEARLVLAATLSPSYGVYSGYERCESTALHSGSEEYLDSEKFARRARQLEGPLLPLIGRLNEIRRSNRSLQQLAGTSFLETANDQLIAYVRRSATDTLIVCVNLDPFAAQEGLAVLPADFPLPDTFTVQDLLSARSYRWQRAGNYLRLEPGQAHIMQVG
jgi:starch synthase (maltosyl-transferring)